jgi:hypothetical protein
MKAEPRKESKEEEETHCGRKSKEISQVRGKCR